MMKQRTLCLCVLAAMMLNLAGCSLFSSSEEKIEAMMQEKEAQMAYSESGTEDREVYEEEIAEEPVQETAQEEETGQAIELEDFSMTVGSTVTLTTENLDYYDEQGVSWKSSHSDIAVVEGNELTALAVGTVRIAARLENRAGYCNVEIVEPLAALTLDQTELTLELDETYTLEAETEWNLEEQTLEWTSSNETVATVKNGKITAKASGSAVITASCEGVSASCSVNVCEAVEEPEKAEECHESEEKKTTEHKSAAASYQVYENAGLDLSCPYPSDFTEVGVDSASILRRYVNQDNLHEIEVGIQTAGTGETGKTALNQHISEHSDCVVTYSASGDSWYAISMCSDTQILYRKAKIRDGVIAWFDYNVPIDTIDMSYETHITYMEANFMFKQNLA